MKLNLKNPITFFDLETTGINIVNDRIVELSMVKLMPNGEQVIKTKKIINEKILTGFKRTRRLFMTCRDEAMLS